MTKDTKRILREALCTTLHHKNIDQITVKDIVTECHLTRQTFYNHFSDIYELVEYSASLEAKEILERTANYEHWQEGFYQIVLLTKKNQKITKNTYQSAYRDVMLKYLFKVLYSYVINIVEKQAVGLNVEQRHKNFIAHFYSLAFISLIFDWFRHDMKEDPQELVNEIEVLIGGDFKSALHKYAN